jgi:hypothetical protein
VAPAEDGGAVVEPDPPPHAAARIAVLATSAVSIHLLGI